MLVFVISIAMAMLFMMIQYSEDQRSIADNVREIIKSERSLQAGFLCVGYISNTLARYPLLNDDLITNIKNLKMQELGDTNYWVSTKKYSNYNKKGDEYFDCNTADFNVCTDGLCNYKAIVNSYNLFAGDGKSENAVDENNHSKIYIEWKLDEYRFYISKLKLIP